MVQVDVVWAYAFGATFAATAARQLEKEEKPFVNKWYVFILLFLGVFFAPSGLYLLWQHPQWETMQVATSKDAIPAWLVVIFAVTNITQGILGYWTTLRLIKKKNYYGAHANWMVAWIIFWFILVCGWDTTGYQRFLYDMSEHGGALWEPGKHMGIMFFTSNVWITLVVMAAFFAPMLLYGYVNFVREGAKLDRSISPNEIPSPVKILTVAFGAQWVLCLSLAIVAALAVMGLRDLTGSVLPGYLIGLPLVSVVYYFILFRGKGVMYRIAKQLFIKEPTA